MTIVSLEELLGHDPELYRAEMLLRNGYREDTIGGRRHYVGHDNTMRAVIGPVRHRAKGLMSLGRKRSVKWDEQIAKDIEEVFAQDTPDNVRTVDFSKLREGGPVNHHHQHMHLSLNQVMPEPVRKPGRWRRLREWAKASWYDEDWHKGAQNTALTTLMWMFTATAAVVFLKGALWVLSI